MFEFDPVFLSLEAARKFERQTQHLLAEKAEKGNSAQEEVCMSGEKKLYVAALDMENGLLEPVPFDTKGKTAREAIRELKGEGFIVIVPNFNKKSTISATFRALRCATALAFGIVDVSEADITFKRSTPWWTSAGYRRILGKGWMPKQVNHPNAEGTAEGWVIPDRIPYRRWRFVQLVAGMLQYLASDRPVLFIGTEAMMEWLRRVEKQIIMELNSHLAGVRQDREARRELRRVASAALVEKMKKGDKLLQTALEILEDDTIVGIDAGGQIHWFRSPERLAMFVKGVRAAGVRDLDIVRVK